MNIKKIILLNFLVFSFFIVPLYFVFATDTPAEKMEKIFSNIGNWLFSFLVAGAVIGVIVGSFTILLSGGDPGKANTGKMIIIYSLIAVLVGTFARGLVTAMRNFINL